MLSHKINLKENLKFYVKARNLNALAVDALHIGYCKDPQILEAVEKWLKEEFPALKAIATDDSLQWVQQLNSKITAIRTAIPIPQNRINAQIKAFQEKFLNEDKKQPARDQKYIVNDGQCSGYAGFGGYALFMQYFSPRRDKNNAMIPRDDWNYFEHMLKRVSRIDFAKPISIFEKQELERIFSLIAGIQRDFSITPGPPWQGDWHELIADTQGRKLQPPYTLAAPVNYWDLSYLLYLFFDKKYAPTQEPRLFLFSSYGHDIVLVQYPEKISDAKDPNANLTRWFFVDCNNLAGIVIISTVTELRILLYAAYDYNPDKVSPIGVRIFSLSEAIPYPPQEYILNELWAVKNNKLDAKSCEIETPHSTAAFIGCIPSLAFFTKKEPQIICRRFIARKEVVEFFIDNKIDLAQFDPYMMHTAVTNNDIPLIKILAKHDPNYVNALNDKGDTPLHTAVHLKHDSVVSVLLDEKADSTKPNGTGLDPFQLALNVGSIAVMKSFHQEGKGRTELPDAKGRRPLHTAAIANNIPHVTLLLDAGVTSFSLAGDSNQRAYLLAQNHQLKEILLQALLLESIRLRDEFLVRRQLRRKPNLNMPLRNGEPLVIFATRYGSVRIMELLISKGIDVNAIGYRKERALHVAAKRKDVEMVKLLIAKGADLLATRADNLNANDLAKDSPEVLAVLLQAFQKKAAALSDSKVLAPTK